MRGVKKTVPAALLMGALADLMDDARYWAVRAGEHWGDAARDPGMALGRWQGAVGRMQATLAAAKLVAERSGLPAEQWPLDLRFFVAWEAESLRLMVDEYRARQAKGRAA